MDAPKPVALVELVTHTSTCINGQNVVLRKREWVRSDDPRVLAPGGFKFDTVLPPALEDRRIQLALVRLCNHRIGKSIDERTGRAIISALRLAQRNLGDQESLL